MRRGDATVVTAKEREKILREIAAVDIGQRADDAKVHADVLVPDGRISTHGDVARGCISAWKKPSRKPGEENFTPSRELFDVDTGFAQGIHLAGLASCSRSGDHDVLFHTSPNRPRACRAAASQRNCGAVVNSWRLPGPGQARHAGICRIPTTHDFEASVRHLNFSTQPASTRISADRSR